MQNSSVTNTLLAIIAVLLLVTVIQNASGPKMLPMGAPHMANSHTSSNDEMPPANPPSDEETPAGQTSSADSPHGFKPSSMVFSALNCPSDATLTLGDPACTGGDVEKRKALVEDSFTKGLPIPKVFDAVVAAFGENALTAQAIEIRRSRGKK